MLSLDVGFDQTQIDRARRVLSGIPKGAEKALCRALNKAVAKAKTETVRSICKEYSVKSSAVRKGLKVIKATYGNLTATILETGSPMELMAFAVKPKKPASMKGKTADQRQKVVVGVSFNTRKTLPHAFVAKMQNGHIGIYTRERPAKGPRHGLPIRQRYTTSVPQMMKNARVLDRISEQARQVMTKELDRQVSLLLGGKIS